MGHVFYMGLFSAFSQLSKHCLPIGYHVYIWQILLHLRCNDICQILMCLNYITSNKIEEHWGDWWTQLSWQPLQHLAGNEKWFWKLKKKIMWCRLQFDTKWLADIHTYMALQYTDSFLYESAGQLVMVSSVCNILNKFLRTLLHWPMWRFINSWEPYLVATYYCFYLYGISRISQ